ncbi:MAG: peptide ABC transporter substrate-binding protein [Pseudomonadota bacterium]|nr:peptide ABC transporter substrate-binding protein [Pseudomonadota bacterium]
MSLAIVGLTIATGGCKPSLEEAHVPETTAAGETVLRKGNGAEPQTLDPHRAQGIPEANILRDLYEGLVSEAPDGRLVAGVARRWKISDGGRAYTFYLRENARWSNGVPLTAGDFAYSLRRCVDPATGSSYAAILLPIKNANAIINGRRPPQTLGVEALDPHTLKISLKAPTPYFLGLLTHTTTYPVYRPAVEQHGAQFTQPDYSVSNGAYVLADWVVASHVTLRRNRDYWDNALTRIDIVKYFGIDDQEAELRRYRAGELDWTSTVPLGQMDWVRETLPGEYRASPYLGTYYYGLNVTRAPFEYKPALRKALSLAIDRRLLVEKVTRGGEVAAYGWVPPGINDYTGQRFAYANWPRAKQIEEAKRLYTRAGYSRAKPLSIEIRYNTSDAHQTIATVIASQWRSTLGVQTTLINEEWKVFLQNVQARRLTEAYRASWIGDYNDANTFAELMHSRFGLNGTGYSSAAYDRLVRQAAVEANQHRRRELLQRAERILLADHPLIPIYFYVSKRMLKPYVQGYQNNIMDHHYTKNLYLELGRRKGTDARD